MSDRGAASSGFSERYVLGERLDDTALYERYAARDAVRNRDVLVNVLRQSLAADRTLVAGFRSHVQIAAGLSHPGFVRILDWGRERGGIAGSAGPGVFVVTERVTRPTIAARGADHPVPVRAAIEALLACTSAVGFAHRNGLVPVGLSPHSIYGGDGSALRVDASGLAALVPPGALDAETVRWCAPERCPGEGADAGSEVGGTGAPDARSDVYELGLLGYFLLTGAAPFGEAGDSVESVVAAHRTAVPIAPSVRNPAVPRAVEALLGRCLAKAPDDRFADMDSVRAALVRARETIARSRPAAPPQGAQGSHPRPAASGQDSDATQVMTRPGGPTGPARRPDEMGPRRGAPNGIGSPSRISERRRRGVPGRIAYAAIFPVLLAVLAVLGFLLLRSLGVVGDTGPKIEVPNLTAIGAAEASTKLADLGLVAKVVREPNTNVPADAVFGQDPPAGRKVARDSEVTLSVSEGTAVDAVPNVVGQTKDAAVGTLYASALVPDIVEVEAPDDAVAQTVLSQDPAASSPIPADKHVRITVATRSGKAKIPDLSGQTAENATISLQQLGFRTSSDIEASPDVAPGKVTRTDPPSDTTMQKGSVVIIYVSAGPQAPVPNVVGLKEADARTALEAKGFKVQRSTQIVTASSQKGFVVGQRPAATESLEPGGIVVIRVGVLGPPPTAAGSSTLPADNGGTAPGNFETVPNPTTPPTAAPTTAGAIRVEPPPSTAAQ